MALTNTNKQAPTATDPVISMSTLSDDFFETIYSFKKQTLEEYIPQLFENSDKDNALKYIEKLKKINCSQINLEFKEIIQLNSQVFLLQALEEVIPFSNRNSTNGELRGWHLKSVFEHAKNDPKKQNISIYNYLSSYINDLSVSPDLNAYLFGIQQMVLSDINAFSFYSNQEIKGNIKTYVSNFMKKLKDEFIILLNDSHDKAEFIQKIEWFLNNNTLIKDMREFVDILNVAFPQGKKRDITQQKNTTDFLSTVLNENLLLQDKDTLMKHFLEENRPSFPSVKINFKPSAVQNVIDKKIKLNAAKYAKISADYFEGQFENKKFIPIKPLKFKEHIFSQLSEKYYIKYDGQTYSFKNMLIHKNGKINTEESSKKIISFFHEAGIIEPNLIAYHISTMLNLKKIAIKDLLRNKKSDFFIAGKSPTVILKIEDNKQSVFSCVKEGKLQYNGKTTQKNKKAKLFHGVKIQYSDESEITVLPDINFLSCPLKGITTKKILKQAVIRAGSEGSVEYKLSLDDQNQKQTVSKFVGNLFPDKQSSRSRQEAFDVYLERIWNLQKPDDPNKKTYGETALYVVNSYQNVEAQITRMFNDFPAPEGLIEAMSSVIKPELEALLKESNINNSNNNFEDIIDGKDFLAIWEKALTRVIFPWVLDSFTGELKSNIKNCLTSKEKYDGKYTHWVNSLNKDGKEGKEIFKEKFICSLFVGPLASGSFSDKPINLEKIPHSRYFKVSNTNTKGGISFTEGMFEKVLMDFIKVEENTNNLIKRWHENNRNFYFTTKENTKRGSFSYEKLIKPFSYFIHATEKTEFIIEAINEIIDEVISEPPSVIQRIFGPADKSREVARNLMRNTSLKDIPALIVGIKLSDDQKKIEEITKLALSNKNLDLSFKPTNQKFINAVVAASKKQPGFFDSFLSWKSEAYQRHENALKLVNTYGLHVVQTTEKINDMLANESGESDHSQASQNNVDSMAREPETNKNIKLIPLRQLVQRPEKIPTQSFSGENYPTLSQNHP